MTVPILIRDAWSGEQCEAELIELSADELEAIDRLWKPYLEGKVAKAEDLGVRWWEMPEHQGWDWASKIDPNSDPDDYGIFAIRYDSHIQGVMIVNDRYPAELDDDAEFRGENDNGNLTIHIEFLSAAPWNLGEFLVKINESPRYRSIGRALMHVAIELSLTNGHEGRVGLYALPQAEGFYEKCGMIPIDRDCDHECLCYYEFTPSGANALRGGAV